MATIQWDTDKEKADYERLSKLRDSYLSQINDLIKKNKSSFTIESINSSSIEEFTKQAMELFQFFKEKLDARLYVAKEFASFANESSKILFDEVEAFTDISDHIKILVIKEFEYYVKGLADGFNNAF